MKDETRGTGTNGGVLIEQILVCLCQVTPCYLFTDILLCQECLCQQSKAYNTLQGFLYGILGVRPYTAIIER